MLSSLYRPKVVPNTISELTEFLLLKDSVCVGGGGGGGGGKGVYGIPQKCYKSVPKAVYIDHHRPSLYTNIVENEFGMIKAIS